MSSECPYQDSSPEPELVWQDEAEAVVQDVKEFVKEISVAKSLQRNNEMIHLNLTTFEGNKFCIELSSCGFRVVGEDYNITSLETDKWYDTPYALLAALSPQYNKLFAESLINKLENLPQEG